MDFNNLFTNKKQQDVQKKADSLLNPNPFLKKNGELYNPRLNYQKLLDDPNTKSKTKEWITEATGITQTPIQQKEQTTIEPSFDISGYNPSELVNMDVTQMPKLSTGQISKIIQAHFGNSSVITPNDARGIYDAQNSTGMSALAILGIGALESGYGTSNIAKQTNNIWGYGATNDNPEGNAHRYSQMSQGAKQFASEFMNTYYNGYGAKSIHSAGTGDNPSGKGYAYFDNGTINPGWADSVGNIMADLYKTASTVGNQGTGSYTKSVGQKVANTSSYNNNAAYGQCVWYVRGRAKEKSGKDPGALGNANQMWYNVNDSAKLPPNSSGLKPNTIASYAQGTGYDGQLYGHVIYIEDVVGDTVYYTEGGGGYRQSNTDGIIKTASKQQILNGQDKNGNHFGSNLVGFIDVSKI